VIPVSFEMQERDGYAPTIEKDKENKNKPTKKTDKKDDKSKK
jgi:hypothetical protein